MRVCVCASWSELRARLHCDQQLLLLLVEAQGGGSSNGTQCTHSTAAQPCCVTL